MSEYGRSAWTFLPRDPSANCPPDQGGSWTRVAFGQPSQAHMTPTSKGRSSAKKKNAPVLAPNSSFSVEGKKRVSRVSRVSIARVRENLRRESTPLPGLSGSVWRSQKVRLPLSVRVPLARLNVTSGLIFH